MVGHGAQCSFTGGQILHQLAGRIGRQAIGLHELVPRSVLTLLIVLGHFATKG